MNKKFLAIGMIIVWFLVALWIWTLATPRTMISIGGSASIDPLMQRLTNRYLNENHQSFIYSSTGSNTGITNLQKGVYDLAFVSKDVTSSDFPGLQQLQPSDFKNESGTLLGYEKFRQEMYAKGSGYYSITFTNEPIVFVYNIERTGLKEDDPFIDKFIFQVANQVLDASGQGIIKEIYDHDREEDFISWYQLAQAVGAMSGVWDYSNVSKTTKVWPYSSVPGSGTWTSFIKITGTEPGEAVNKYGNNGSIFYQILKSPGSFGFISMTYAQTIARDKELSKKLRTVGIQSGSDVWWVYKDPHKPDYPLSRPFNVVLKLDANTDPKIRARMDKILNFVYWFCTSPEATPIFREMGLTQAMIDSSDTLTWESIIISMPMLALNQIEHEGYGDDYNQTGY